MARVVLKDTGQVVLLASTPEYQAEIAAWRAAECTEHKPIVCRVPIANGGKQVRPQCQVCGKLVGNSQKHSSDDDKYPMYQDHLAADYERRRENEYNQILQKHARLQVDKESSFFHEYNDYLKSDVWRAKRERVLKRAQGICEGCGIQPASQVHHLTYEHKMEEFLFELVAVCDTCHDRLHAPKTAGPEVPEPINTLMGPKLEYGDYGQIYLEKPCDGCRYGGDDKGMSYCGVVGEPSAFALSQDGACGPDHRLFEPLK